MLQKIEGGKNKVSIPMFVIFGILLFLGMPIAFAMAISGVIGIISMGDVSLLLIPQKLFMSINTFPLLAVPLFILAGEIMTVGGIIKRIVNFATVIMGRVPGSLGYVNVLSSMIMAGFSGSATADAVAIGGMMIPAMNKQGYPPEFSAGITASSACIGPIIPPSLTMVIYGALTGLSVGRLFLAGLIPGICIGLILMLGVFYYAKKYNYPKGERAYLKQKIKAFREVSLALLAPVIIIGGLVSGVMTATETGVVCSAYAFFLGFFVYKEIKINQILKILTKAAINTAIPIIIMVGAASFGWVLAYSNFAGSLVNLLFILTSNTKIMLMLIILMLLIIGLFVEGGAATIIFVPILFPIGNVLGYDPYQFAMIVEITLMIGTITPPVGLQLYIASNIAKVSISKTIIWPFAFLMLIIVILIVFFPFLATFLPSHVFG